MCYFNSCIKGHQKRSEGHLVNFKILFQHFEFIIITNHNTYLTQMFEIFALLNSCVSLSVSDLLFLTFISFQIGYFMGRKKYKKGVYEQQNQSHNIVPLQLQNQENPERQELRQSSVILSGNEQPEEGFRNPEKSEEQFFLQKIKLEGKKIQEKGIFSMYFEKNQKNPLFVRKIERHEIITDYLLEKETQINKKALIPIDRSMFLPDENSILEIDYFHKNNREFKQKIQKRIVNLSDSSHKFSHIFFDNGKFKKIFRNPCLLGQGSYGTVLEAYNILQGRKYALKKIYLKNKKNISEFHGLLGEIKILSTLSHLNIVRYHTCWIQQAELNEQLYSVKEAESIKSTKKRKKYEESIVEQVEYVSSNSGFSFEKDEEKSISIESSKNQKALMKSSRWSSIQNKQNSTYVLYVQMELCQKGNLGSYLKKRKQIHQEKAFRIMEQLLDAVQFLHQKRIVHRDLKPENIFFDQQGFSIKIGDFGLSLFLNGNGMEFKQIVGTPSYIAPELYKAKIIKEEDLFKADVYALGVIYYQMLNLFQTSHERGEKLNSLKEGRITDIEIYPVQRKLIKLMTKKKEGRLHIKEIKKHAVFKQLTSMWKNCQQ